MESSTPLQGLAAYSVLMPLAPWEPVEIVAQALESLECQTWTTSQVVISCDGQPPPQLQSLLESVSLPLEVVIGPGGEGVGPVLARGLLHCREEMVLRADADDVSMPERAAVQVRWMQSNPGVRVMGTPINEFEDSVEQPLMQRWVPLHAREIAKMAFTRNPFNHPSVILRRSSILAVGNYGSMPGFEDYELWLRLLSIYGPQSGANIAEPLVFVRVGAAHLRRRHGWNYALAESGFLLRCGRTGLLPWICVFSLLLLRVPLRLISSSMLAWLMRRATRRRLTSD